jgi:ribosomal protein S18 acetylase RimI-like enzyme
MSADPRAVEALDAHLAYLRHLTVAGGGVLTERHGVMVFTSPASLPALVNGVARLDRQVPGDAVIDAVTAQIGQRGYEVLCLAGRDDDLRQSAEARGLKLGSDDPLQYLEGRPITDAAAANAEIRRVDDVAGVRDLAAVNQDAGEVYDFPRSFFAEIFAKPETVLSPSIEAVVAYVDGEPLATAQVHLTTDIAYVAWVAVARRAMRRGLGRLVTADVIRRGLERGATATVLMASPMGAPLYRRMGFQDVGVMRNAYFETPAAP